MNEDILDHLDTLKAKADPGPLDLVRHLDLDGCHRVSLRSPDPIFPGQYMDYLLYRHPESNGEFIVTLVNNYEILAARLRAAEDHLNCIDREILAWENDYHSPVYKAGDLLRQLALLVRHGEWRLAKEQGK